MTHARVGDTICSSRAAERTEPLPGYSEPVPVVYCGLFPVDSTQYQLLRESIERLCLNDAALQFEPESSSAMGFGFRYAYHGYTYLLWLYLLWLYLLWLYLLYVWALASGACCYVLLLTDYLLLLTAYRSQPTTYHLLLTTQLRLPGATAHGGGAGAAGAGVRPGPDRHRAERRVQGSYYLPPTTL